MDIALGIVSAVIALVGLMFAAFQIRRAADALERSAEANQLTAEANNISNLMAVLQLEESINQAGYRLLDAVKEDDDNHTMRNASYIKVCTERYLNAIDRFCQCIRTGIVDEEIYRQDYRRRIEEAVEKNSGSFGTTTSYLHVMHVYQSWKADKSAVDESQRILNMAPNRPVLPPGKHG